MVERLCVERNRKSEVLDVAVGSHDQQLCILPIGEKEDCPVEMYDTQVMVSATLLSLLCKDVKPYSFSRKRFAMQMQ